MDQDRMVYIVVDRVGAPYRVLLYQPSIRFSLGTNTKVSSLQQFGTTRAERKLSASLIGTLTLEDTLPQFEEQIWTQVCPSAKIAQGGAIQHFLAEFKGLSALNVMDLTNQRIIANSGGATKRMKN